MDTAKRFYCDVAVCGGGPAGAAAAIAAGREGKSVILMELRESLGG
ncbi:MAG: FAD-dependent oxidoreductase, partial [Firmicutes bacterium]|nr:FAD-dependent oxidoreductase [Bacillota bacterium]